MKKMLLLAMAMFLVGLFLGSGALTQDLTVIDGTTMMWEIFTEPPATPGPTTGIIVADLAPSGGPSLLLPGAALLLGTGVLTYSVLRRGR